MKNTKSKVSLVLFVLCSVLILFSSCQKKAETSQTTSAKVEESTAVKTETKTAETAVKAEEPAQAAKTEETAAAAKAEEPAVVSQSVVETKAEETAVVKTEESASPAQEAVEEPVYSDTLTYKGFNTTVVVDNTKSSITLPNGVGLEEVEAVAGLINSAYPEEAALVSYELDGDTLVLTYPEQSDAFLLSVVDTLRSEAMALLNSYVVKSVEETTVTVADVTAPKAQTEAASESKAVYRDTLSYRGLTTSVAVYNDNAMIRVPEGVSYDDVAYVAEMVCAAYPAESSLVYYDYKDGVLSLTYPEQTDEFLLAVVDVLRTEAMALIDKAAPSEKTETVKAEEKTQEEEGKAVVITETAKAEDKGVLFTVTFSYNGYNSDITVTNTTATLTIPEGISAEDIAAVAKNVAEKYPSEAALITYSIENGRLVLSYPEQSGDYLKASLEYVEKEAKALLDLYPVKAEKAPVETAVAAVSPAETAPAAPAKAEDGKTEAAPVETAPVEETKTAAAPVAEEEAKASAPQTVEAVSPVTAPVVAEKTSAFTGFSVAAVAEPKFNLTNKWAGASPFVLGFAAKAEAEFGAFGAGLKVQYDMSAYILASVYGRYTFASLDKFDFYALLGAGASFGVGPNNGQKALLVEAGLGADYSITEKFSVFGELTAQYSIRKPGFELGLSVGGKYTF